MNVFFDDVRNPPAGEWEVVRDPEQLKDLLLCDAVDDLSMDHDLQCFDEEGKETTGYDVLCWAEETGHLPRGRIFVHSKNPVGRMKMMVVVQRLGKE